MANKKIPFKYARPVEEWLQEKGNFLLSFYFFCYYLFYFIFTIITYLIITK